MTHLSPFYEKRKQMKKIICFLLGHDWEEKREIYGKLDNGKPIYKKYFGCCKRCGKNNKERNKELT
jgi:hypothetical protein